MIDIKTNKILTMGLVIIMKKKEKYDHDKV
jgi:hypothetical protein